MPKGVYKRPADMGHRISEGKKPGSVAMKKKVRRLYLQGLTPKNIERATGVARTVVKAWVVDLPKHSTGFSRRRHGPAAARVARLTKRDGSAIRQEMEDKENDPCVFCRSSGFDPKGWFGSAFHHYDDGCVDRAHKACNAVRRHQAVTNVEPEEIPSGTDTT